MGDILRDRVACGELFITQTIRDEKRRRSMLSPSCVHRFIIHPLAGVELGETDNTDVKISVIK